MDIKKYENYDPGSHFYNFDDKLKEHIFARSRDAFLRADAVRDGIKTKRDLEKYARDMKERFISAMGGIPYNKSYPLDAKVTGTIEEKHLTIEKIIFKSREGVYVTGNLYIPKNRPEKCGAVLFQCGHSPVGKAASYYQRAARAIATSGLIVFAFDPVGQGERLSYYEKGTQSSLAGTDINEHQYFGEQCTLSGKFSTRYFIADAMRALDYLESRPEVDSEKIGTCGVSGGGLATCHMMVCDERIKAAAPGAFLTNRREYLYTGNPQDDEQIWFAATEYGFDHNECLLCFAPKPVLIMAVDSDFFAIEGTKEIFNKSKKAWGFYNKENDLRMVTDKSTHGFTLNNAIAAGEFFSEVLNGKKQSYIEEAVFTLPDEELYATKKGSVKRQFSDALSVFDENAKIIEDYQKEHNAENAKKYLRECVDYARKPAELNIRRPENDGFSEYGFEVVPYVWFSQKQMPTYVLSFKKFDKKSDLPVTVCLFDKGTDDLENHIYKIRDLCDKGQRVLVLDLAGIGKNTPKQLNYKQSGEKQRFCVIDRLTKDLFFLGDSLCALRLFELEYAIKALKHEFKTDKISIYSEGKSNILADLYSLLDENIKIKKGYGDSLYKMATTKYYEDYNCAGYLLPGILKYIRI